jgi:hypothetical protein
MNVKFAQGIIYSIYHARAAERKAAMESSLNKMNTDLQCSICHELFIKVIF